MSCKSVQIFLLALAIFLILASSVSGAYVVEVTLHSYDNPTGRCAECQTGLGVGCCDEDYIRPSTETCPNACDPVIDYCVTSYIGGPCVTNGASKYYESDSNHLDLDDSSSVFGSENVVRVTSDTPWNGIQFILSPRDCSIDANEKCGTSYLIDTVVINIDDPVGTSTQWLTYVGSNTIAQFTVSYTVRCADNHYGGDCTVLCYAGICEGCGLYGFTGDFCQQPMADCGDVYCNGNGECNSRNTTCTCYPGYSGSTCLTFTSTSTSTSIHTHTSTSTSTSIHTHTSTSTSTYTHTSTSTSGSTSDFPLIPVVAGAAGGGVLLLCLFFLCICVVVCMTRRRKTVRTTHTHTSAPATTVVATSSNNQQQSAAAAQPASVLYARAPPSHAPRGRHAGYSKLPSEDSPTVSPTVSFDPYTGSQAGCRGPVDAPRPMVSFADDYTPSPNELAAAPPPYSID